MEGEPELQVNDWVRIIRGPIDKVGKIGRVRSLVENGAFIELGPNWITPIRFINLNKIDKKEVL